MLRTLPQNEISDELAINCQPGIIPQSSYSRNRNNERVFVLPLQTKMSRRSDQQRKIFGEDVPLFKGYGTHFVYLYVGTPPQRVSVIIDTGSHITAFPCTNCKSCGFHTDAYWNETASSTARKLECEECINQQAYCARERCMISQSYGEGSSWVAYEVQDTLYAGTDSMLTTPSKDKELKVIFTFGCITDQSDLFDQQRADGIMGMSRSKYTLIWQLHSKGLLSTRTFGICMDEDGGILTLGSDESLLHSNNQLGFVSTSLQDSTGWFKVELVDIVIGNSSINTPSSSAYFQSKMVIFDTGTTYSYLPLRYQQDFETKWQLETGVSYNAMGMNIKAKDLGSFPPITFIFSGGVNMTVYADVYLNNELDDWYAPTLLFQNSGQDGIIGQNVLRNHDILFDSDKNRIGITPANCSWANLQKQTISINSTTSPMVAPLFPSSHDFTEGRNTTLPPESSPADNSTEGTYPPSTPPLNDSQGGTEIIIPPQNDSTGGGKGGPIEGPGTVWCKYEGWPHGEVGVKLGCASVWTPCDSSCMQHRHWPLTPSSKSCELEERSCTVGLTCPLHSVGYVIKGVMEVTIASKVWTASLSSSFSKELAGLLTDIYRRLKVLSWSTDLSKRINYNTEEVKEGDVTLLNVSKNLKTHNVFGRDDRIRTYTLVFLIHTYPNQNSTFAEKIQAEISTEEFSENLRKKLLKDSDGVFPRLGLCLKKVTTFPETVAVIPASNSNAYVYESLTSSPNTKTSHTTIAVVLVSSAVILLFLLVCIVSCIKWVSSGSARYELVDTPKNGSKIKNNSQDNGIALEDVENKEQGEKILNISP